MPNWWDKLFGETKPEWDEPLLGPRMTTHEELLEMAEGDVELMEAGYKPPPPPAKTTGPRASASLGHQPEGAG